MDGWLGTYRVYSGDNHPIWVEFADFRDRVRMLESRCTSTRADIMEEDGGVFEAGCDDVGRQPFYSGDLGVRGVWAATFRVAHGLFIWEWLFRKRPVASEAFQGVETFGRPDCEAWHVACWGW